MSNEEELTTGGYLRNWITIAGVVMMFAAFLSASLIFLQELIRGQNPYSGILYLIATAVIVVGFIFVPAGMLWERNRQRPGRHVSHPITEFRVDLNRPEHVYGLVALLASAFLALVLVGFGSYRSFHATESVEFCGQLCHTVMNPDWVRYNESPHARVKCAECHIGEGADWFVKAKISGLRQVWAVFTDSYDRPIPTPIHDLRPARETCEQCHWRRKFTGYKELVRSYYLSDEENTLQRMRMLLKIGGEKTASLKGSGIHCHMLIANKVEYIATNEKRLDIAWVRIERADGSVTEYNNEDNLLTEEQRKTAEVRTMDCMDCHNRPAHQFPTAMDSVNVALEEGTISLDLPSIKVQAVTAIDGEYGTNGSADAAISEQLRDYYESEYPKVFDENQAELERSISKIQQIYRETVFPEMKAKWSAYPNHIGHRDSPGCFRCHNDSMQSEDGETIFTDCNRCHLIIAQGESIDDVNVNFNEGLPFVHPEDFDEIDEYADCAGCHDGGAATYE